jgi:hypothetical protein
MVVPAIAERREEDREDVQAVVEVLAEATGGGLRLEVPVRGRDDAQAHPEATVATAAPLSIVEISSLSEALLSRCDPEGPTS